MSAVAAVVSQQGAVLLSDGITFRVPEDLSVHEDLKRSDFEIVDTDKPKIFKVNDRVGVSWVGNIIGEIQQQITGCGQTPKQVGNWLSEQLKSYHRGKQYLLGRDNYNILIGVTGFDEGGTPWGIDISSKHNFTPNAVQLAQGGLQTMCRIPFVEGNDSMFDLLLEERNKLTTDPEELSRRAFTEMIRYYEDKDHIVGGQIFSFRLYP
ncbi:hypothetical protein ACG2F4_14400 [Halalkalibaculum sp. DA3122]|uniref:hypothetical protein n=1 Tax=Halalkalibaculum sp. DA3122 TaxID=3373607 RepID=UPI00375470ED